VNVAVYVTELETLLTVYWTFVDPPGVHEAKFSRVSALTVTFCGAIRMWLVPSAHQTLAGVEVAVPSMLIDWLVGFELMLFRNWWTHTAWTDFGPSIVIEPLGDVPV
jgi:hypothetical protein